MNYIEQFKITKFFLYCFIITLFLNSCGIYKPVDSRNVPSQAKDKARQNLEQGKGVSIKSIIGNKSGGNFEFSSSNPMWRASLEILDFLPLTTVDYSGGIIITDWYTDSQNSNESLKVTVRFLSNEIRSDSIKIIVHSKICTTVNNCKTSSLNSKIQSELISSILRKAALLNKDSKNK